MKKKIENVDIEKHLKDMSLLMAVTCVRNTIIEDYHAGIFPESKTGDYSDVKVVTPSGEIPWNELSRISDKEMEAFNISVVDNLYTFLTYMLNLDYAEDMPYFSQAIDPWYPRNWNEPKLEKYMLKIVENYKEMAKNKQKE